MIRTKYVLFYVIMILLITTLVHAERENAFLVDTNVIYTQGRGSQTWPGVAFDGTNHLVVWEDTRCYPQIDIYCARVNSQGIFLDSAGIHIGTATYDYMQDFCDAIPAVAFNGSEYLVAWQDRRNSSDIDIYGARLNASGVVLDSSGIAISTASANQRHPAIISDGTDYFVVWQDERSGVPDICGARVTQTGVVLDPNGIPICSTTHTQKYPAAAFDGTNYLVVWQDARDTTSSQCDIYGARVSVNGIVIDTDGIAISDYTLDQLLPSVDFDGTNFLIVWEDRRSPARDIYGTRMDTAGVVLEPNGIAISADPMSPECSPAVAFDGTNYLVVWEDDRNGTYPDIYGARVDQGGVVLDALGIPISVTQGQKQLPAVAFGSTDYLVAWHDDRDYPTGDIYGARVSTAGTVLDPAGIDISLSAVFQNEPAAACDGANFLIAWSDLRAGLYSSDIYGTRIDAAGNILDSPSFVICNATFGQYSPVIAFDGINYCVVWTHNIGGSWAVKGTRVSRQGIVLNPSYINISSGGTAMSPHCASNNLNHLVVWVDYRDSYTSPDIYGARLDTTGIVLDPGGIAICTNGEVQYSASVASDGSDYLVVWRDNRNGLHDIYGARVTSNGNVLDPNGILVSTATSFQDNPSVAFDGNNYLVVWDDERNGSNDIYGARITQNGVVLDPDGFEISTANGDQTKPSVSYDGTNYVIVWEDNRNGPVTDLYGALVDASSTVIDSFAVSTQSGFQLYPITARGPDSNILVTYSGWAQHINTRPANAMRVWGTFYPPTGIEEQTGCKIQDAGYNLTASPNPFTHTTNIRFMIHDTRCTIEAPELKIFDAAGRLVKSFLLPTTYCLLPTVIPWSGVDDANRRLPGGVYFVMLTTDDRSITEKILLVR